MMNNSDSESADTKKNVLTVLGSGTCVPSLRRSACSILLETSGNVLLFDCGPGTMRRLTESGRSIFDITHIFLSHFHPDHCGELVTFLFATKYSGTRQRNTELFLIGGKGIIDFFTRLKSVFGDWIELPDNLLTIIEMNNKTKDSNLFDPFTVKTAPVEHNPESIAYRINTSDGESFVYSGDTDYSESLIDLARNADILVCESALPDEQKVKGHLTPSLAGDIATKANVAKLVLIHFYPECDEADIEAQCRNNWAGELVLAEDLMRIEV